ncbi:MAG: DUF3892 domain-containing protein [Candidatus Dojkabacteria bacterium]|jgi:hypothetical protein|nr:DUF3892 domain-containing protein [Candidatus Dojkabacteria bacterium]
MSEVEIVCINKDNGNHNNPHEGITHYGWKNSVGKTVRSTRDQMLKYLDDGNHAYVISNHDTKAYCYIRTSTTGNRFLQTYADSQYTNNLLSLNECLI